jgi:polyhydroxyalkanoate synthase subunit PhaC
MAKTDEENQTSDSRLEQFGNMLFGAAGPFTSTLRTIDPQAMMTQTMDFYRTMFDIALGKSDIAPDPRDARFKDKAWQDNPFYKRTAQAYLAMTDAVEAMIPADLEPEDKARADLAVSIVTSTLAPTNTLLGNPAAMNRTIETGGANLARGFQNFLKDMKNNGGMPSQVDDSDFEVGRNMAMTPGKIVLRTDMFELIHYAPSTAKVHATPVLLVPPQIGRYYFTDLTPGRSFAEYTVAQGLQYFAISWRNPQPDNRDWGLEAYIASVLEAVEAVSEITAQPSVNLVGFCAGGILSAIVAAYLSAKGSKLVNTLTLCVTMLDFKTDAALGAFRFPVALSVAKAQSQMKGILPAQDLSKVFTWLRPNDLVWNYWVNNYLMGETPSAFDILAWNKDSTNLPARLHKEFLELFEENKLIRAGAYVAMGEPIDLGKIDCDNFVVGAVTDHLTPWKCCYEARKLLGGDSTFALSNGGHVAALVNPPGNPKAFHVMGKATAPDADSWQEGATKHPGSWWEGWTVWVGKRSGKQISAPKTTGSKRFKPLSDAPGDYVRS